jgi:hypothetical protein
VVKTARRSCCEVAVREAGVDLVCTSTRAQLQLQISETETETETQMKEVEVGLTVSERVTLMKATAAHSPCYLAMLIAARQIAECDAENFDARYTMNERLITDGRIRGSRSILSAGLLALALALQVGWRATARDWSAATSGCIPLHMASSAV